MDFGTAATTAASAANNVTQNLNTTILQLQDLTAGVETAVKDISESAGKDGVDLGKLFKSVTELEGEEVVAREQWLGCVHHFLSCSSFQSLVAWRGHVSLGSHQAPGRNPIFLSLLSGLKAIPCSRGMRCACGLLCQP